MTTGCKNFSATLFYIEVFFLNFGKISKKKFCKLNKQSQNKVQRKTNYYFSLSFSTLKNPLFLLFQAKSEGEIIFLCLSSLLLSFSLFSQSL
jgi:hypothetical protein